MTVQNVLAILSAIIDKLEDMSIERDSLLNILHAAGYSTEDVQQIWTDAKSDPEMRSRAHRAFADARNLLTEEGISSLLQVLPLTPPESGPIH